MLELLVVFLLQPHFDDLRTRRLHPRREVMILSVTSCSPTSRLDWLSWLVCWLFWVVTTLLGTSQVHLFE